MFGKCLITYIGYQPAWRNKIEKNVVYLAYCPATLKYACYNTVCCGIGPMLQHYVFRYVFVSVCMMEVDTYTDIDNYIENVLMPIPKPIMWIPILILIPKIYRYQKCWKREIRFFKKPICIVNVYMYVCVYVCVCIY